MSKKSLALALLLSLSLSTPILAKKNNGKNKEDTAVACADGEIQGRTFGAYCTNDTNKKRDIKVEVLCQRNIDGRVRPLSETYTIGRSDGKWVSTTCGFNETPVSGHLFLF